jgi:hypothetical protein
VLTPLALYSQAYASHVLAAHHARCTSALSTLYTRSSFQALLAGLPGANAPAGAGGGEGEGGGVQLDEADLQLLLLHLERDLGVARVSKDVSCFACPPLPPLPPLPSPPFFLLMRDRERH